MQENAEYSVKPNLWTLATGLGLLSSWWRELGGGEGRDLLEVTQQ